MHQGTRRRAALRPKTARRLTLAVATITCALAPAATAGAANQVDCSADALKVTVADQSTLNPITTTKAKCADSASGLPNTTDALALDPLIKAQTAFAVTETSPDDTRPLDTTSAAAAGVEGLTLPLGTNSIIIGADAVRSFATAKCTNGALELAGGGTAVKLTINNQEIPLDPVLGPLTDGISSALGVLIQVKLNEQIKDGTSLIQRGARVTVLPALGAAPLAEVVIAESRVSGQGTPCDPNVPENAGGGSGGGVDTSKACPKGATFDAPNGVCVITADRTGGQGQIVIGAPFQGPSGGTVLALTEARRLYGSSPCVKGSGPAYVVVGTNGADRITGTNGADRILARGGNDAVDGGRGNDCLDGGSGRDNLNGAIGNDKVYGLSGNDALNGGPGTDYLSGGSGNDSINAAYGADRVFGGAGNDAINVSTAGPPARVSCGTGRDKLRANPDEVRRARGCETIRTFRRKA